MAVRFQIVLNTTDASIKKSYTINVGLQVSCFKGKTNAVSFQGLAFAHYTEAFKKNHRVILSVLKELGHGIGQVTEERILEQVDDLFREFRKHDGQAFDPRPVLIPVATGAVLSVLFGRRFQFSGTGHRKVADNASTFVENMDAAIDVAPLVRFLPKFRKKIAKMASSSDGLMQGLDDGIRFCKEAPDAELSLVKRFLEIEGPGYDHEDLLYSLRDFCLGGTGTVASTILWALLELANHPQIQRRIHQEVDEMLPGDRAPLLSDRPRLPYVEAVLLEVMRRHTMVPLSLPHATLRDTETCGYFVPKGCLVSRFFSSSLCVQLSQKKNLPNRYFPFNVVVEWQD